MLELPSDVTWIHKPNSRYLFLRPALAHILREVLRLYDAKKQGVVVTSVFIPCVNSHVSGTPGIGKSWFGELLLWVFTRLGIRVIYEHALTGKWFFFDPASDVVLTSPRSTDLAWPAHFRNDMHAVLLFDPAASGSAVEPLLVDQFTVVTSSPNRLHFKEFYKRASEMRFLPSWTLDDLKRILPFTTLAGSLVQKEVALVERFQVVGGIPRKLFDDKPVRYWQHQVLGQLRQNVANVRSLLSLEVIEDYNQAHNNLVVIYASPPAFDQAHLILSSAFVRLHYQTESKSSDRRKLADEIWAAWNDPTRAVEAGKKFEPFAFGSLVLGGKFPYFPLLESGSHASSTSEHQFGPFEHTELFTDLTDLMQILPNVLYRPSISNFPVIDFFAVIDDELILFQMTVSTFKPSPLAVFSNTTLLPLLDLYASTFSKRRVVIVFVAPDFILNSFKLTETGWVKKEAEKRKLKKEKETEKKQIKGEKKMHKQATPLCITNEATNLELVAFVLYIPVLHYS